MDLLKANLVNWLKFPMTGGKVPFRLLDSISIHNTFRIIATIQASKNNVRILGFCIIPDHWHGIVV